MPQIENPRPAAQAASALPPANTAVTQPLRCAVCRPHEHWWHSYREVLLSTEALASLIGFALLATGWVMAWTGIRLSRWFYLAAAVISGLPILRSCWESLRERRVSVEVLVALAIVTSVGAGQFHAAAVVAVMLLGGGVLEQITIARARRSLAALLVNMPETALVRRDGKEVEVPVSELRVGDRIITRPGERLAVDGSVVAGESAVDESPITGESVPKDKQPGDKVFAGSINKSGALEIEAQKVGDETTLARILRLVEEAQASQAPIQRIADKAAQWYVPAALATAAVVWALTGDITRGITVLIVFCPCALVLATPTAIIASIGHAARRVILVKGGEFAEAVGQIQIVGFDKTGTLTIGKPTVTEVVPLDSLNAAGLLRLAASAERFSEHPLGIAIRRAAEERQISLLEPVGFHAAAGCGVEAQVDGQRVLVGRADWLEKQAITFASAARQRAAELETSGHTALAVAVGERVAGLIAVRDVLRPEAKEAVSRLKKQNIRLVMLTGDNERVAKTIATEAGIEEIHAGLLPEDKLRLVRDWQAKGQRVAFIGDGINDAPALAAADIGIAMGAAGTDMALETSDIAFLSDDLTKMPEVVALSRRTLKVIRQNIGFSVFLNILSVVAAGLGWISPIGGAVIHEAGAMAVIINAVRLLR
jgi:Cd2+/Zn2+-exporting ATPase